MAETPKRIKRLLREHVGEAHEEELRRALVLSVSTIIEGKVEDLEHGS